MKQIEVDVAVIGAGTAGLAAYRAAIAGGARAVIIEGGPHGTTCARVGCMPSKLLIAAAEAAHAPTRFEAFGLRLQGGVKVDGRAVMSRVRKERDRFVGFVLDGVASIPPADRLEGHARFLDDATLQVGQHTRVAFSRAVIATGSTPAVPPILRALGDRLLVSDDVFEWSDLPASVAVFGPGVIGLELGQALHRLGVKVWIYGVGGAIGPLTDPEVRRYAANTFQDELDLNANAKVLSVDAVGPRFKVLSIDRDGVPAEVLVDHVIAATGRTPNLRGLGLENTSLSRDRAGVPVFDRQTLRCGDSAIFIAGDANQDAPLLHEAADEGRIAGENAASWPRVVPQARRSPLTAMFTDPQIAMVGQRWTDLVPGSFVTGAVSFEDQGRSRVMLRNRGLLHVYADRESGRFLGAEMVGPDAEHLAHLLAWAHQANWRVEQMLAMPFYHPVVEEGVRTALRDAQSKLLQRAQPLRRQAA